MEKEKDYNKFIKPIAEYMYHVINHIEEPIEYIDVYGDKWYNKHKVISHQIKKPTTTKDHFENIKEFIDNATKDSQSFMSLWELCEFIRWAEKLTLYTNESTDIIYCDTAMNALDNRVFSVNLDNMSILFRLTMSRTLSIKQTDDEEKDNLDFSKVIEIIVDRKYGKQMKNKFVIVDQEFKCNDQSDIQLMDMINYKLNNAIRAVVYKILVNVSNL